jgi:hypothetical protein
VHARLRAVAGFERANRVADLDAIAVTHGGCDRLHRHKKLTRAHRHDGTVHDLAREVDDAGGRGAHNGALIERGEINAAMASTIGSRWRDESSQDLAWTVHRPAPAARRTREVGRVADAGQKEAGEQQGGHEQGHQQGRHKAAGSAVRRAHAPRMPARHPRHRPVRPTGEGTPGRTGVGGAVICWPPQPARSADFACPSMAHTSLSPTRAPHSAGREPCGWEAAPGTRALTNRYESDN